MINFIESATIKGFKGLGNILLNGFDSQISQYDKVSQVGISLIHFSPINEWVIVDNYDIVDVKAKNAYCGDSQRTVRLKCAALFAASLVVQPIGLTLNLLNRIGKCATGAQLWFPSSEPYKFKARACEWVKDFLIIVATPLILIGMLFSALYGAIFMPYDGRKLSATFERLAYSGGYQFFNIENYQKDLQNYLLAPCFQPEPKTHLGGGELGQNDVW